MWLISHYSQTDTQGITKRWSQELVAGMNEEVV
jgi:hypothetical protein